MKKVLLTGATGDICSNYIRYLIENNYDYEIDTLSRKDIKDEDIRNHLRYVGNIFDSRDIMDL